MRFLILSQYLLWKQHKELSFLEGFWPVQCWMTYLPRIKTWPRLEWLTLLCQARGEHSVVRESLLIIGVWCYTAQSSSLMSLPDFWCAGVKDRHLNYFISFKYRHQRTSGIILDVDQETSLILYDDFDLNSYWQIDLLRKPLLIKTSIHHHHTISFRKPQTSNDKDSSLLTSYWRLQYRLPVRQNV